MTSIFEVTEFDEQAKSKSTALANLRDAFRLYLQGKESMGVVQGYENASLSADWTTNEIECLYVNLKNETLYHTTQHTDYHQQAGGPYHAGINVLALDGQQSRVVATFPEHLNQGWANTCRAAQTLADELNRPTTAILAT